eukprot:6206592-Pleurochrysis_carterae.AAC.4
MNAFRRTSAFASPKQFLKTPTAAAAPSGSHRSVDLCESGGGSADGHFSFGEVRICAPEACAAWRSVSSACGLRQLSSSRKKRNSPCACRAASLREAPR